MADIILKDGAGSPVTHEGVKSLTVPSPGNKTAKFSEVSGNIAITQNGVGIDVSSYATARVNVASGGSNIDFGISVGDTVETVFFNTIHDLKALDAALAAASYPQSASLSGITMPWNNLLVGTVGSTTLYVHIGDLSALQANTYIIYVMDANGSPTVLYSTKAFDASSVITGMVVTAGWQVSKFTTGVAFVVTSILEDFAPIKDNYFAKSIQVYGDWELFALQDKTVTLGSAAPAAITPDEGYNGLGKVEMVLDSDFIYPSAIKTGVTILGVAGSALTINSGSWYMAHTSQMEGNYYKILEKITSVGVPAGSYALVTASKLSNWYKSYGSSGSLLIIHSDSGHNVGDLFNPFGEGWKTE